MINIKVFANSMQKGISVAYSPSRLIVPHSNKTIVRIMYCTLLLGQKVKVNYAAQFMNLHEFVKGLLREEHVGKCSKQFGYILGIEELTMLDYNYAEDLGPDEMMLNVHFVAKVFRPYHNQVFDGVVLKLTKAGLFVSCGPMLCFLSRQAFPEDVQFSYGDQGKGMYESEVTKAQIKEGSTLHLMIIGMRPADGGWFGIVTLATEEDDEMYQCPET